MTPNKKCEVDQKTIVTAIACLDFVLITRDFDALPTPTESWQSSGAELKADTIEARHRLHEALGDDGDHIPQDPMALIEKLNRHLGRS